MKLLLYSLIIFLFTSFSSVYASKTLVTVQWLKANLKNHNLVLIDMSDETQYQRFHIKKALHLPYHVLNKKLKSGVSLSIGRDNIIKLLGLLGITPDSHVVVYDDIGGLHAGRLFWELERIKHKNVSLLDGGLVKWILDGYPVTATPHQPAHQSIYPAPGLPTDNALATIKDVHPGSRAKDMLLIDVRTAEEYRGDVKYRRSGHIPGAKLWSWDNAVDFDNQFKFKPKNLMKTELAKIGLTSKYQPVTLYCRSAHRAAQSYVTLRNLGFENVKVYDGSIKQYEITVNAPLIKGNRP
ncbi:sulfurtransferase [Beggiatoa alba]|nr:sulfurtransferase [Beggiatoa alba]